MDWSDDTDTQPSRGPSQQGPEAQGRSATSQTAVRHEPNPMKIDSGVDVAASESSGVIWSGSVRPWYADAFPIEATPIPQHQSPIQESHIGGYPSSGEEAKSSLGTGLGLGQEVGSGRLSGVRLSAAIESDGYLPDARDLSKSPTPEMTSPMISRGLAKSDGTGTQSEERVCVRCHNLPFPVPPQLPPGGSNGFGYPFRWRNGYLCDRCKMLEHAESLLRGMVVFQSMLTDTETTDPVSTHADSPIRNVTTPALEPLAGHRQSTASGNNTDANIGLPCLEPPPPQPVLPNTRLPLVLGTVATRFPPVVPGQQLYWMLRIPIPMQVESIETPMPSRVLPRPVNVAHSPSRAGSPIDAPQYGPVTWGLRTESESTSIADPSIQAPYPRFGVFHQGVRNQSVSGPAGPTRAQPFLQSFAQPFTSATQSSVPPQSYNFERIPSSVPRQSYPGAGEQINIASSAPPQSYPGAAQQINTRPAAPPQSNSRAVQQTNTAASTPFQGDPAVPEQMTVFHNVTARTAKCDVCGERNTVGMTRCSQCGWQTCHPCTRAKGYTRRHGIAGAEHFNQIAEANLIPFFTPKNKGNRARKPTVKKNQQSGHKNASKGETQTQQESQTAPPTSARPPVTSERHPAKPAFNTHCNIGRGKRTASRRKSQQKTTAAKGGNAGGKATLPTSSFTDMRVTEASAQGTMPAFSVGRAGRGSSRYSPGINAFATNTTPAAAIGAASHDSSRRNPRPHPPAQNITPAPAIDAASADASSSNRRPTPPASFTTPAVEVYGATYNSVSNNTAPNTLPAMRNMRVPEAVPQDELEGARILCAISGMAFQGDVERRTRIAAELNARPQPQPPTSLANRNADRSRATRGLRFANSEDTESEGFKDKTDSEYDEDSDMESSPSDTIAQRTKRRRLSKG